MLVVFNFSSVRNEVIKIGLLASPCLSVRLSEFNYLRSAKQIFMKFYTEEFYYNLSIHSSFGSNLIKLRGIYMKTCMRTRQNYYAVPMFPILTVLSR
jgi:hypothetical protein